MRVGRHNNFTYCECGRKIHGTHMYICNCSRVFRVRTYKRKYKPRPKIFKPEVEAEIQSEPEIYIDLEKMRRRELNELAATY